MRGIGILMATRLTKRIRALLYNPKEKFYPYQLQFHLTNYCNLRCVFCPTKTFVQDEELNQNTELSTEQWLNLINQAADLGVEEFHICGGGEPFFFQKKALAVMARIKELGKSGEIITNGTLLKPESIRKLVKMGWDKMTFSLDGPNKETHDAIRATPCFERITANIGAIATEKAKAGAEKPQLCVHMVVCSLNYRTILEMIPLCTSLGVDTFLIQALNIWSQEIEQYKLSEEQETELHIILNEAQAEAKRAELSTNIQDFLRHDLFSKANTMDKAMMNPHKGDSFLDVPCYMLWYNLSVFADGRVLPCFILRDKGVQFKEHSLAEAWDSDYFHGLRRRMLANKLGKDCAKCNPWSLTKTEEIRAALKRQDGGL